MGNILPWYVSDDIVKNNYYVFISYIFTRAEELFLISIFLNSIFPLYKAVKAINKINTEQPKTIFTLFCLLK